MAIQKTNNTMKIKTLKTTQINHFKVKSYICDKVQEFKTTSN